jgi:putative lipoprotein
LTLLVLCMIVRARTVRPNHRFSGPRQETGPRRLIIAAVLLAAMAEPALAQSIRGTAAYRERIALPPTVVFEATLEDVSRADAPADVIARTRVTPAGAPPIRFEIPVDLVRIRPDRRYVVRGQILESVRLVFTTDAAYPVLTQGHGTTVAMMLRRVAAGPSAPPGSPTPSTLPKPRSTRPLEKTYWKASELDGKPVLAAESTREVYILLGGTGRVAGSDGCNRVIGSYVLTGDGIKFGALAGTQMACPNTADTERGLRKALSEATRWTVAGDRLELFDATGRRLAQFEAVEGHDR